MKDCNKKITVTNLRDYPIDSLESLPDYLLCEREVVDEADGNTYNSIVRVPTTKIIPNANLDNITSVEPNNTAITVPTGQVRACRMVNNGTQVTMQYAGTSTKAQFLAVGTVAVNGVIKYVYIQNSGFVYLPKTHSYIIGVQYYSGANGVPTTDSSSGQKLFIPITNTKLAVNMSY